MGEIQKLVLAICAVESFSKLSSSLTNMNSFWRHAVYTGLVAQALARRARILHPERLFVAGTLHDIGSLLINKRFPEIAERTIRLANGDEDELPDQELASLGFDHAYLGGLMLESWQLPSALVDAVRSHHAPNRARVAPIESAIVKIADTIAADGQFDECNLTLRELTLIRESLVQTLMTVYHQRISYPGFNPPSQTEKEMAKAEITSSTGPLAAPPKSSAQQA